MSHFALGRVMATPAAMEALASISVEPGDVIARHANKDWAELDEEDRASNERAILQDQRVISIFCYAEATKVYVITEHDRSVTTLLLPTEY